MAYISVIFYPIVMFEYALERYFNYLSNEPKIMKIGCQLTELFTLAQRSKLDDFSILKAHISAVSQPIFQSKTVSESTR